MRWPWISRLHHEELVTELRRQLAQKEDECRRYLNLLGGFGTRIFNADDPEPESKAEEQSEEIVQQSPLIPVGSMRPSQIMRTMDRKAEAEYQKKMGMIRRAEVMASVGAVIGDKLVDQA